MQLEAWPDLCIATVMKRTEKKRVVEVTRKITRGTDEQQELLRGPWMQRVQYLFY